MQPLLVIKEETLPEHQEWSLSVDQEDIKEEEKLWISQQGEQLQQLEEADLTKFGFTVKSEDNDEKPESSQLHQSRSDESTEAEPVASSSSVHRTLTTEADGENDGGPQPASKSGPNSHLQPGISGRSSDSSGTETDDSYDWKQTRECQQKERQASRKLFSCFDQSKRQKQKGTLKKHMIIQTGQKVFVCSECGQRFGHKSSLNRHMIIHTGEKPFVCTKCGQRFGQKSYLNRHMIIHTDMQPLLVIKEETLPEHQEWSLSVDQEDIKEEEKLWISQQGEQLQQLEEADLTKFGFTVKSEDNDEKPESSQLHQSRSDESTEAEPVASSSSVHRTLTTEADGEDDGGPQPASKSGPNSHLQPDISGRSSDSSGTETDDSYDWKQTREC
ncbi:zinc finger protein 181-like, partial [Thalassophryne amazonica]|uniref:zinc finger protein 181-like n=1 Tax=Thalassophryne amazonica TaxID=390379 RepID=UPI001471D42D